MLISIYNILFIIIISINFYIFSSNLILMRIFIVKFYFPEGDSILQKLFYLAIKSTKLINYYLINCNC